MFYFAVGVWFLVCLFRLYKTPAVKGVVMLIISSVLVSLMLYQLGTPQGAGVALSLGVIPALVRLLTSGIQNLKGQKG